MSVTCMCFSDDGLELRGDVTFDGEYMIRLVRGSEVQQCVGLSRSQAELLCNDLLSFVNTGDPMQHAVDMSNITAAEIRAHWQQQTQQGVEIIRALNHMEKGYKNGA